MFSDLNPLSRSTAILEIVIMLLGAAILGFLIAWLIRKPKAEAVKTPAKSEGGAKGNLAKLEKLIASLKKEKAALEEEVKSAKELVANQKKEIEKLKVNKGKANATEIQMLKEIEAKYLELRNKSKEESKQVLDMKARIEHLGVEFEKEKAAFEKEKAAAFARELEAKKKVDELTKGAKGTNEKDAAELPVLQKKIRELQSQNFNLVTEIQKLKVSKPIAQAAGDEMEWLRKEKEGLEKEVEDLEGNIDRLQNENSDLRTQARDKSSAGPIIEKLEKEKEKLKAEIAKLKKGPSTKKPLPNIDFSHLGKASLAGKDDLTKISGIGPVVEGKLNGLGIFTFSQIAKLSNADMEAIDELLQLFPGRVKREKWLQQATQLLKAEG